MNRSKRIMAGVTVLVFLSGCAPAPSRIKARYTSPVQYQNYECNQISQEMVRVKKNLDEVTDQQDRLATKDAVAMGVGMLVLWPALFFLIGDNKEGEVATLKGEYEALQQIAIEKGCTNAMQFAEAETEKEKPKEFKSFKTLQEER